MHLPNRQKQTIFKNKGFMASGFLNLTPREAFEICKQHRGVIVDVRMGYLSAYRQFDCPQVVKIPLNELEKQQQALPKNQPLIVADSAGLRSHEAMEKLKNKGFNNIANLAGGLVEWERDQLPVNVDNKQRLTGSCMCQLRPKENK